MQLGRKIKDLRLRRGLTVQQLGEATGLSKGFISQVENSRTSPSLATLQDLARANPRRSRSTRRSPTKEPPEPAPHPNLPRTAARKSRRFRYHDDRSTVTP